MALAGRNKPRPPQSDRLTHATTWMTLENTVSSEIKQPVTAGHMSHNWLLSGMPTPVTPRFSRQTESLLCLPTGCPSPRAAGYSENTLPLSLPPSPGLEPRDPASGEEQAVRHTGQAASNVFLKNLQQSEIQT